jgi:hypothetical protein
MLAHCRVCVLGTSKGRRHTQESTITTVAKVVRIVPPLETSAPRLFSDDKSRDVLKLACRPTPECDLEHKVSLNNIGPVMWSANEPERAAEPGPARSGRPFRPIESGASSAQAGCSSLLISHPKQLAAFH